MTRVRCLGGAIAVTVLVAIPLDSGAGGLLGSIAGALGVGDRASVSDATAATGAQLAPAAFEPVLGLPATKVTLIGASPAEAAEEAWAYGTIGDVPAIVGGKSYADQHVLLERTAVSGWQVVPLPAGPAGEPVSPSLPSSKFPSVLGPLGGRTTSAGGVVLLTDGGIVTRDPGGTPQLVPPPDAKADPTPLGPGESLPPSDPPAQAPTPYAAIDDTSAHTSARHTGVLIAPYRDGEETSGLAAGILRYDGSEWTREPITVSGAPKPGFTPKAIGCGAGAGTAEADLNSPSNCWLLVAYESEASAGALNRLGVFRRVPHTPTASEPSSYVWEEESPGAGAPGSLLGGQAPSGEPLSVTALGNNAQMLTITAQGAWVDFQAKLGNGQSADISELVVPARTAVTPLPPAEKVLGPWCYPATAPVCPPSSPSLGSPFPAAYASFAWPGAGTDPGARVISGLPHGALLGLSEGRFSYEVGAGGDVGGTGGAAFSSPGHGVIGTGGAGAPDQQGSSQVIDVTSQPQGNQLQETPVPFRYPLLAVAQAPGSTSGDPGAQAVAVGVRGEIGRYLPGQGWRPESLYDSAGRVQTPTLRGVAWPQPGRAYAVGDNGAMWLWRADTGLWEPDPAKPLNLIGNLTAVAFSSTSPNLGYAVGKDGVLLRYGKSWAQVPLPASLQQVNFTSVSFAAGEALATYRTISGNGSVEVGGVAVEEDGSGLHWHVDPAAATLAAQLPGPIDTVLSKVTGLADGGAVAAGPGLVIERDSLSAPWRFSSQPLSEARNVSALGAYRDGSGAVRAVVSIDLDQFLDPNIGNGNLQTGPWSGDVPPPSGPGQPPPFAPADPLPDSGYLLKETASGWRDMENMALAASSGGDMPVRPDPVLGVLVDPSGRSGLAVGGQTYDSTGANKGATFTGREAAFETSAAMRFGVGAGTAGGDAPATITTAPGHATFAVGGDATCAAACADFSSEGIGPDVSLTHALQSADQIAASSPGGLRGFLYTGGRLAAGASSSLGPEESARELSRYESLLAAGGSLPVHAASSPGVGHSGYYSFSSTGPSGGPVNVIVLDYSTGALGSVQQEWLKEQLAAAKQQGAPAIVMGDASLGLALPDAGQPVQQATDSPTVSAILVQGGASAYLFDYPSANVQGHVSFGGGRIPAFGSGTLGYTFPPSVRESDYLGSSGFLLLDVETAARNPATNVAPVSARIEPNIGQLALNATDGVFLRRSQIALFEALARRPAQGISASLIASGEVVLSGAEPYDPVPFNCLGANCADAVPIDYTFSSSNPDIGDFVAHDPTSANPRQALLGANRLPIPDSQSGLFCAFNSGTTTVSITTGGLRYSEPVAVQAGSVEYPCGTVPLKNPPTAEAAAQASFAAPEPPLASSPPPANPLLQVLAPPPPPVPPAPVHPKVHVATPVALLPFVPLLQPLAGARPAIVPPPAPPVARPIPPSGTSQVTAVEKEREEESATEVASSGKFTAYDANRRSGPGPWILLLAALAAGAGVGIGRGHRSSLREQPALALAASRRRGERR